MKNWAGNITFGAERIERPRSLEEVQEVVRQSRKARVLGSGHSFNRIADTDGTLVSLAGLPRLAQIDAGAGTIVVDGGATYADIVPLLHAAGHGLGNVASLPHITVVGAVATATHGSGDGNRNLAAAVSGVKLITASGDMVSYKRGEPDFDGAVVNLGALGIVSELTLDIVPAFDVRQNVYLGLPVPVLLDNMDEVMASAYSVSLFTRWQGDAIDQVWIKALAGDAEPATEFLGARGADRPCHPVPGMNGEDCTGQLGLPGPWHERLFHFPIGHKPSAGAELQSEYFVSRQHGAEAFAALHAVRERIAPALLISEVRSVAADDLWLSTAYGRDSIGFHFTWKPDWDGAIAAAEAIQGALAPFETRPHWAKLFTTPAQDVQALYPRFADFRALADRLDPDGKFRNAFVEGLIFT